jgi:LPS-assembly lipoprotein
MRCFVRTIIAFTFTLLLFGCGFHLQGETSLAPPLHRMFLQTPDPYGSLARTLHQYLKMSHVEVTNSPSEAETVLEILSDTQTQNFVTVGGTQQTRQYNLVTTVIFQVTDSRGRILLGPQTLTETRGMTVQMNQILGTSNEATMLYQQMHLTLAYNLMNRLSSREVTQIINANINSPTEKAS